MNLATRLGLRFLGIPCEGVEISDRIVGFDSHSMERKRITRGDLLREFQFNRRAMRIIEQIPADSDGSIQPEAADRLLVTVHCEMQRLSEEFQHGRRMAELLNPLLAAIRTKDLDRPLRVVDIGCGTGFVLRWLAAHHALADDVELIGADYHSALIAEAQRLADAEGLRVTFKVANAFQLNDPADVFISTGIIHHFRGQALVDLFAQHAQPGTRAFLHFDFHQSPLAPYGSWLFHTVRMREALARYDGVLSAVRAYTVEELLAAARSGAPMFTSAVYGVRLWGLPIPRAFNSLVGVRAEYHDAFVANLGQKIRLLGVVK